jgi:hypothetical protein
MHPASSASLRVASSFRRHEDDKALRARCRKSALQLDPRNSAYINVRPKQDDQITAASPNFDEP